MALDLVRKDAKENTRAEIFSYSETVRTDANGNIAGGSGDTFVDIIGGSSNVAGLTLTAGTYLIGYSVVCRAPGVNTDIVATRLHDGSNPVANSGTHFRSTSTNALTMQLNHFLPLVVSSTTTYKLQGASNNNYGGNIIEANPSGGIAGETNSKIWALRIS